MPLRYLQEGLVDYGFYWLSELAPKNLQGYLSSRSVRRDLHQGELISYVTFPFLIALFPCLLSAGPSRNTRQLATGSLDGGNPPRLVEVALGKTQAGYFMDDTSMLIVTHLDKTNIS